MNTDDYLRIKRNLELTGLNDKQVHYILQDIKFVIEQTVYRETHHA